VLLKHRIPIIGKIALQRNDLNREKNELISELDQSRQEIEHLKEIIGARESGKYANSRLFCLEGVLLDIPENILSEKFKSDLMNGTYEDKELGPIKSNLKSDDIVLELGAAVGFISTWVAKQLGVGRVITYEANPNIIPVAKNTHKINEVKVELHHALVGSGASNEGIRFFVDKTFFWDSGVYARAHNNGSVREEVVVRQKSFQEILYKERPTILIIDIEGGEKGLFDNVKELDSVRHIFFELHTFIGPNEIYKIFKRLDDLGFYYDTEFSKDYIATFSRKKSA